MRNLLQAALVVLTATLPASAIAYVGPGAGLSLLGALWALVAAVGMALLFIVAWPLRKMLRRRRAAAGPRAARQQLERQTEVDYQAPQRPGARS